MSNFPNHTEIIDMATLNILPNILEIAPLERGIVNYSRFLKDIPEVYINKNTGFRVLEVFVSLALNSDFSFSKSEIEDICSYLKNNLQCDLTLSQALWKNILSIIDDIQDIHGKMSDKFNDLDTYLGINTLNSDIITIYRQVLTTPLSEIEAQVDMQITTIANNIMLRRLSGKNQVGEDSETKAMAGHILRQKD